MLLARTFQRQLTLATINCNILQEVFSRPNAPFETDYFLTAFFPANFFNLGKFQSYTQEMKHYYT